jgi:hypothetical protein
MEWEMNQMKYGHYTKESDDIIVEKREQITIAPVHLQKSEDILNNLVEDCITLRKELRDQTEMVNSLKSNHEKVHYVLTELNKELEIFALEFKEIQLFRVYINDFSALFDEKVSGK